MFHISPNVRQNFIAVKHLVAFDQSMALWARMVHFQPD